MLRKYRREMRRRGTGTATDTRGKRVTFKEGEWIRPTTRGFRWTCCRCGTIHWIDFDHMMRIVEVKPKKGARRES